MTLCPPIKMTPPYSLRPSSSPAIGVTCSRDRLIWSSSACGIAASTASVSSPTASRHDYASTSTQPGDRRSGYTPMAAAWPGLSSTLVNVLESQLAYQFGATVPSPRIADRNSLCSTTRRTISSGNNSRRVVSGSSDIGQQRQQVRELPQIRMTVPSSSANLKEVTGCSGITGRVVCVDNFFTGARRNIEHLLDHKHFEVIRHDITFALYVEVDEIFNLACPASPIHYQHDPVQTTKTSVHGAINMLGLAKRLRAKILQASTSEVYGDPTVHPQPEDYWGHVNPVGPRSCYDESKRCAETLFFDYRRQHNLQIKVARIFKTYGPRMHPNDGRVVSNFIVQALLDRDITVYGEGLQTRSFCYVDDLIDGRIRLMDTPANITGPVNIGNPSEFTILELAEMVVALVGSRSKIVHRALPENDPKQRQPDIALAQELLGWSPARARFNEDCCVFSAIALRQRSASSLRRRLSSRDDKWTGRNHGRSHTLIYPEAGRYC